MPTKNQAFKFLLSWIKAETGLTVIKANQKTPRPERPYASLRFLNPSQRVEGEDQQSMTKTIYPAASGFYRVKLNTSAALDAVTIGTHTVTYTDPALKVSDQVEEYEDQFEAALSADFIISRIATDSFDVRRRDSADFAAPTYIGAWIVSTPPTAGTIQYTVATEGMRKAVASINIFGENAIDTLAKLRDSLDRPDVIEDFDVNNLVALDDGQLNDLTALQETEYEERGQLDLTVAFVISSEVDVGTIDEVDLDGTVNGKDISVDITI